MINRLVLITISVTLGVTSFGQTKKEKLAQNRSLIEERIELLNENQDESADIDFTTLFDSFNSLLENPLNLNTASIEDLHSLFFLTEIQLQAIVDHREKYGELISIYELKQLRVLDMEEIYFMLPFVTINEFTRSEKSIKGLFTDGKNEIWLRYQRQIQNQNGFLQNEIGETPYLGSSDRLYLRYRYTQRTKLSLGITGEKDAGEEFFKGSNINGFDFYSGHLFYKSSGVIKRIALGDFHAKFSQGLVLWSGYAFGKSADVNTVKKPLTGLKANTSVDENLFLRGVGITLGSKKTNITILYSRKQIDGNLFIPSNGNSTEANRFTSVQNTGLHRTPSELEGKDRILETHLGTNITTTFSGWRLGLNAIYTQYDLDLDRNLDFYNQFEFSSRKNAAYSLGYGKVWKNVNLYGEFARSENQGTALINGFLISLNKRLSLSTVYRNYSRNFHSILANGFGETGGTKNERGLFTGITYKPNGKITVTAYADRFKFPWLRFRVDAPSTGIEYLAQFTYKPHKKQKYYLRYRSETKMRNASNLDASIHTPVEINKKLLRLNASFGVAEAIQLKFRVEFSQFSEIYQRKKNGILFYQDLIYKSSNYPIQFTLRYAHFDVESYDARIYSYESDLLYVFSVPPYFGRGSRMYAMAKFKIGRKVNLWVRWSQWFYNDRKTISTGNSETQGNIRDEIKVQMRWKF